MKNSWFKFRNAKEKVFHSVEDDTAIELYRRSNGGQRISEIFNNDVGEIEMLKRTTKTKLGPTI